MSYLIISAQLQSQLSLLPPCPLFPVCLSPQANVSMESEFTVTYASALHTHDERDLPCLHVCVCVFVRVNLFALRTRGVFWWTLSHPEQKRQQVLSSAACFLTISPPPKGVTFSPCFVGLCIFLFSIRSYMIIFNLPCRPDSLQYHSWPDGGDVPNSASFPCGIYLRSRWEEEGGLGACSYLH